MHLMTLLKSQSKDRRAPYDWKVLIERRKMPNGWHDTRLHYAQTPQTRISTSHNDQVYRLNELLAFDTKRSSDTGITAAHAASNEAVLDNGTSQESSKSDISHTSLRRGSMWAQFETLEQAMRKMEKVLWYCEQQRGRCLSPRARKHRNKKIKKEILDHFVIRNKPNQLRTNLAHA